MENQEVSFGGSLVDLIEDLGSDEDEEEFRSCCGDEVWKETDEPAKFEEESKKEEHEEESKEELEEETKKHLSEFSAKMFFKGVSIPGGRESDSGYSGIGVIVERSADFPVIEVQKRLDFYLEESVADFLALMDGLVVAMENNIRCLYAFTDSKMLFDQIMNEEKLEIPLVLALKQRILERTSDLEVFMLNLVPTQRLERSLQLALVAVGIVTSSLDGDKSLINCSICCEDRPSPMMITMKCAHKFCSHCMKTYIDGKVQLSQVPIMCPQPCCKYYVSATESKSFLPVSSYESFERALDDANALKLNKIYCPYANCSVLLDPREYLSSRRANSSNQSENSCVECPVCERSVCVDCGVPWHALMSCEEFQNLPEEERHASDITLHRLARSRRWRRCQQCHRMIELAHGCYHMACRCGHQFCYLCGAEYRNGEQTCQCAFWEEEENSDDSYDRSVQESEQWAWETFNSLPMLTDAYSEPERSQLALIQRFLAGGFSLSDHHPYQSPPRCAESYVDAAMKELHQLPWLERFVSVISDDYYEEYSQ